MHKYLSIHKSFECILRTRHFRVWVPLLGEKTACHRSRRGWGCHPASSSSSLSLSDPGCASLLGLVSNGTAQGCRAVWVHRDSTPAVISCSLSHEQLRFLVLGLYVYYRRVVFTHICTFTCLCVEVRGRHLLRSPMTRM